jgi:hypothetical protein
LKDMIKYVKSEGIEHNPTAAHSPQSNGVAERMNRTLFDMVCPMLDGSRAPLRLWAEAILTACHIRNRLPTSSLGGKTPYEAWTGRKPRVGHLRKFGCTVYRHILKKSGRRKLDTKSVKGYLVGYESDSGLYRVWHPDDDSIWVSRDLIIDEDEFIDVRDISDLSAEDSLLDPDALETLYKDAVVVPPAPNPVVPAAPAPVTPVKPTKPPDPVKERPYGLNRRQRRPVVKAFSARVSNASWAQTYGEAEQWEKVELNEPDWLRSNLTESGYEKQTKSKTTIPHKRDLHWKKHEKCARRMGMTT